MAPWSHTQICVFLRYSYLEENSLEGSSSKRNGPTAAVGVADAASSKLEQ